MYFDPWFLQSTAGASLLANASPLTLMTSPLSVTNQNVTPFGMLGGLVPVTMPFQFPLELLGFGTDTAGVTTTSGSTSAAFHHSLTQSKWGSFSYLATWFDRTGSLMNLDSLRVVHLELVKITEFFFFKKCSLFHSNISQIIGIRFYLQFL